MGEEKEQKGIPSQQGLVFIPIESCLRLFACWTLTVRDQESLNDDASDAPPSRHQLPRTREAQSVHRPIPVHAIGFEVIVSL